MWGKTVFSILCGLVVVTPAVQAEIYKWMDSNGKTHFSDRAPQSANAEPVELKINTYTTPKIYTSTYRSTASSSLSNKKVVLYGTSWCGVCKKAKRYFHKKGIQFKEYDIETSTKGKRDFERLGGKGVPVIMVDDRRMDGFSEEHFSKMYGG